MTGLEINFVESDYSFGEGSNFTQRISLQFRNNQRPFNITLSPVTVDIAEREGLGVFIDADMIDGLSRATAGDKIIDVFLIFISTILNS